MKQKHSCVQACIDVVPKNSANFNVDNVRVVKILGGGAHDSKVVKGVVIKRSTEGSIQDVTDAKVAVFAQGVDTASTETKVVSHHVCTLACLLGPLTCRPTTLMEDCAVNTSLPYPFIILRADSRRRRRVLLPSDP